MAMVNRKRRFVLWNGKGYHAIRRFDGHDVDLQVSEKGGGLFTQIPFSCKETREKYGSEARAEVCEDTYYTDFTIFDDAGMKHVMRIPNEMKQEIANAIAGLVKHGLLPESALKEAEAK